MKKILPDKIPPMDTKDEKVLVGFILSEICREFGVKVNINPIIERGMATPAKMTDGGRTVLIGASHMCRTAGQLLGLAMVPTTSLARLLLRLQLKSKKPWNIVQLSLAA